MKSLAVLALTAALAAPLLATSPVTAALAAETPTATLVLATTPLVRAPGLATVTGRLTGPDGAGLAGQQVQLLSKPWAGAKTYAPLRTVTTGADGSFSTQVQPSFHTSLQARYGEAVSADAVTKVQLAASTATLVKRAIITDGYYKGWTQLSFVGAMAPTGIPSTAIVQYLRGDGTWVGISGWLPVRNGTWTMTRIFETSGTVTLRVIGAESANWFGSGSRVFKVRIDPVP